jgi:hypothetical protein
VKGEGVKGFIAFVFGLILFVGGFSQPVQATHETNWCPIWAVELDVGLDDVRMHTLGCDSVDGFYFPAEGRCNSVAYDLASRGYRDKVLIALTEAQGCIYAYFDGYYELYV